MQVVAKFKCVEANDVFTGHSNEAGELVPKKQRSLRLVPVWEENGRNREWSEATPNGELKMTITNPKALVAFEVGCDYLITFAPVVEPTSV